MFKKPCKVRIDRFFHKPHFFYFLYCLLVERADCDEDGSLRLCTDNRVINRQTELFPFPMPRMDNIIDETDRCSAFSGIERYKEFLRVALREEYKIFIAFVTPFDVYEYSRLPFVRKNSPPGSKRR